ncbi:MAG: crossover junction endodeoxyribonuclease RuvC [Spirochaetaceae bacterium]|nr:crossover junction endodeoxyribonuclease RuvC [Spirochaetaceae bacterium]
MPELPQPKALRVLGLDPGLGATGYGIIDCVDNRLRLVAYGAVTTQAGENHGKRLLEIFDRFSALIAEYRPGQAVAETLFFARNVTSALAVSEARGVLTLCMTQHGVPLAEYAPNTIKQSVTGSARSDKRTVQEYVRLLLGMTDIPRPDHAADALAAAITYIHTAAYRPPGTPSQGTNR